MHLLHDMMYLKKKNPRWLATAQKPVKQERKKRSQRGTTTARSECLSFIRPSTPPTYSRDWTGCTDSPQRNTTTHTSVCVYVWMCCVSERMNVQYMSVPLVFFFCHLIGKKNQFVSQSLSVRETVLQSLLCYAVMLLANNLIRFVLDNYQQTEKKHLNLLYTIV